MRYPLLSVFALVVFAGCSGGDSTEPNSPAAVSPAFVISDGVRGGNVDFFFLPPMVANPSGKPGYEAGAFNPNLKPVVTICALNTSVLSQVPAAVCKLNATLVKIVTAQDEQYHYNWSVPNSSTDVYYRIAVTVGAKQLGFADVVTSASASELKNVDASKFVAVKDGRTLPIKFRIEKFALCSTPGVGPCSSETINFSTGGEVTTQLVSGPAGVTIPAQSNNFTTTITAEGCPDLNPRVTDLPVFGPCVRVTANPALSTFSGNALADSATVFICSVTGSLAGMSPAQQKRVTLHRFDAPDTLAALPHAHACEPVVAAASIKGLFRDLAHGAFKSAGGQLVSLMLPKPLYAAPRRLDVGAGGFTDDFSDFQFALPAKLEITAGNGQVWALGSALPVNPRVRVTDLAGDSVPGARVRFSVGSCAVPGGTVVNSDASGYASASWTLSSTPGLNIFTACGRGLAGSDNNGPRGGVDPFQPLSTFFSDLTNGPAVPVLTGSVVFTATGAAIPTTPIVLGSGGYSSYGPFGNSTQIPDGWPNPPLGTSLTVGSQAPFAGLYGVCTITSGFSPTATFPENTNIFVTKRFIVPTAGFLDVTVRIDNDLKIWVDGVEKTASIPASTNGSYDNISGFWKHDNCADFAPALLYNIPVSAGLHTISLQGRDRGTVGYLDMSVVLR